jgi:hypothetical protein
VRVEPGEIEAVLGEHLGVRQSVVVAREEEGAPSGAAIESKRLVGYVVPDGPSVLSPRELRGYLKERLPEYMVPTAFVVLEELPLTPNGKVDRRALPAPEQSALSLDGAYVAPRFFELGGHSLLATQVISRVRDVFGVYLPLRSLFEEPTVAGLAERIEAARWVARNLQAPSTTAVSDRQELEL